MPVRTITLSALAAGAVGLAPQDAPPPAKYRVDQTLSQEVDATAAGGPKQQLRFSTSSYITVTLADSAGGKTIRVRVDSIRSDSAAPMPAAVLDSARGAQFHGYIAPSGKLLGMEPVGDNPIAAQVQGLLSDFYPYLRPGLKAGDTWADTTAKTGVIGTDSITVRRVSTYRAGPGAQRGPKSVQVSTEFSSTVNGTQPTPEGPAKVDGTSRGSGTYHVSTDGRYLGGSWELRSALTLSGSFAPRPLPVTVEQTTRVTLVK